MKKILMIAGVAFLVSLAAGAGGRMALAPPPPPEATAENGDAATTEAGHGATTESGHAATKETVHGESPPAGASHAAVPAGQGVPESGGGTESAAAAGDTGGSQPVASRDREAHAPAGDGERPLEFREMGHILSSMQPKEAGLFLSYLDDDRAAGLLRAMTVADAAAIIARVPKERGERLRALLLAELSGDK
jgi:hypothetical protein